MTGLDLEKIAQSDPTVALASAIVRFVNEVAALLRSFRSQKGLKQSQVAELLGLTQARIAQLESGKPGNAPSLEQLAEYAFHTGKVLSIRDSAELAAQEESRRTLERNLAAVEESRRALERKAKKYEAHIREQQERIRSLQNTMARLMVMGRTMREFRTRHAESQPRGIGVRLREFGNRIVAAVSIPSSDEEFFRRYLTRPEMEELASSIQTCAHKDRTRVDTVLNVFSDVIQRHASSSSSHR